MQNVVHFLQNLEDVSRTDFVLFVLQPFNIKHTQY